MIGERIKQLREEYNYSQTDLAEKLNVVRTSVLAWENQTSQPALKHIVALENYSGCQPIICWRLKISVRLCWTDFVMMRSRLFVNCSIILTEITGSER